MSANDVYRPPAAVRRASRTDVGRLFAQRATANAGDVAVVDGPRRLTYAELNERVNRLANGLAGLGLEQGDRVALLARNLMEYVEVELAAAKLGAITAAQNWRLAEPELRHCLALVSPKVAIVQPEFAGNLARAWDAGGATVEIGPAYEALLAASDAAEPQADIDPEDGLLILYTSGTTGLPKGALISHRAMVARAAVWTSELNFPFEGTFLAWPPFYHMASTDQALGTLMRGGTVEIVDGYQPERLIEIVETQSLPWLMLMPGMVEPFIRELKARKVKPKGLRMIGAMADLVPRHQIAEVTELLGAPFLNTFGATETGIPPGNGERLAIGVAPESLAKRQSAFCEIRLVDADGNDVADGEPGELLMRGPTLFSGYWNADGANARDFAGGWFHMGDVFRRTPDGRLDFVDRVKYMIKSGGENIYPAEIEQVIMGDARVADAVVVRKPDARWGEVPVAFVARRDDSLGEAEILARCRAHLAGYKQPKEIRFIAFADLPRSTSGKIQRQSLEKLLADA